VSCIEGAVANWRSYFAYGLEGTSALPLPERLLGKVGADVRIATDRSASGGSDIVSVIRCIAISSTFGLNTLKSFKGHVADLLSILRPANPNPAHSAPPAVHRLRRLGRSRLLTTGQDDCRYAEEDD
jgi:hypothetical protein